MVKRSQGIWGEPDNICYNVLFNPEKIQPNPAKDILMPVIPILCPGICGFGM